jgi:glyceraldehyde-3-phosphate dehydrogenase (ferredoxin)
MKKDLKVFTIDAETSLNYIESYKIGDFFGPADLGFHLSKKNNSINIGTGLFADSTLSGSNRLIFTGNSPCWDGFYISTMGGAGLIFDSLDISLLSIAGKAKNPSVLYLNHNADGKIESKIEEIDIDKVWQDKSIDEDGGVYSLMNYVLDKYKDKYKKEPRILATGPSAKSTDFGAVCSAPIKKGKVTAVDTWAGRGGFGSKLFQEHGIAAIIYGGVTQNRGFRDRKTIDKLFEDKYQMNFKEKDKKATSKYNYVDILKTGGTLGVNYSTLGGNLLSFNYSSIHETEEKRVDLNDKFITNHYLKQFNKETIEPKNQKTCGEPCATMCKKMNGKFKKDYEPYQAMGPLSGIFDQRAAEKINKYSDAYGFDAISIGGVISWLMECIAKGYLSPEDIGIKKLPQFDENNFDVIKTSMNNADVGIEILDAIVEKRGLLDLSDGARVLAHKLSKLKSKEIINLFSYNANGKKGWMVPNQYWTPGVLSPMALMGKYYMYYGDDFVPPRELGHKNAQRFIAELMIDNIAVCRFHRGWAEEMTPKMIGHLYGLEDEFVSKVENFAIKINEQGKPIFWESQKNIDIVDTFLKKKESIKYFDELKNWLEFFEKDKNAAAKSFWEEIYQGVQESFSELKENTQQKITS